MPTRFHFAALFLSAFCLGGCSPTITKHIKVQRHVDKKPSENFQRPLDKIVKLSPFGERSGSFHTGIDIRGRRGGGDKVYASRGGRVTKVGWIKGYGKQVTITHTDGYKSKYAHLRSYKVKLGQTVKTRQAIGIVGKTGHATGAHLHFEITTPDGYFIDPWLLLQ